jgi:putative redox protein
MKINIQHLGKDFTLKASNEEGQALLMDASSEIGGTQNGMRPMQVLLASLGGCAAIDVLLFLKKQKTIIHSFELEVEGWREKTQNYSLFKNIFLHFKITGNLTEEKAERAVKLSLEKYCSVAKTLEPTATIGYRISIHS